MVNYKLGYVEKKEIKVVMENLKQIEKIDEFTSSFKDEDTLKVYLYQKGLLKYEELKKNLKVVWTYSNETKKLPIVYEDMKKYLDEFYLRAKYMMLSNNVDFLEKIARHYSIASEKFNPQGVNVSTIRRYISDVRVSGRTFEDKYLSSALNDMFIKVITKLDTKTGELKDNYRGLRDLALFVYNYENKLSNDKQNEQVKQTFVTPKVKTKKLPNPNQLTFDDLK